MKFKHSDLIRVFPSFDFGSPIAEQDSLLNSARVETSVFNDLFNDKVDLIPGTKGSGKSALYRIFVDFLSPHLLQNRNVVIAHGVQHHGDDVFHVFNEHFNELTEDEFVNFWCIYLVSLANEHFIKSPAHKAFLDPCAAEITVFLRACEAARIPEFKGARSLRDVLGWALNAVLSWKPRIKHVLPNDLGEVELDLFRGRHSPTEPALTSAKARLPQYVHGIKESLESILRKSKLKLWLMIDRLDEIFPRRSELETRALRGLLRTLRIFESQEIRVKVFLRDDILDQVVGGSQGFTALTHVTARQSDTLRWSEDQILTMIVRRLFAHETLSNYMQVDRERIAANREYQAKMFYSAFPAAVFPGSRRSPTLRWIYNHVADGRGVVTPRDVIELLTKAKQRQFDAFASDSNGESDYIISPASILYGFQELSKKKKTSLLDAEFPHLSAHIKKLVGGKTEYSEKAVATLFGRHWSSIVEGLVSVGLVAKVMNSKEKSTTYKIPFLYRHGLDLTQGRAG